MFVCGGLGEIDADMPEANALSSVVGPTGNKRLDESMIIKENFQHFRNCALVYYICAIINVKIL